MLMEYFLKADEGLGVMARVVMQFIEEEMFAFAPGFLAIGGMCSGVADVVREDTDGEACFGPICCEREGENRYSKPGFECTSGAHVGGCVREQRPEREVTDRICRLNTRVDVMKTLMLRG